MLERRWLRFHVLAVPFGVSVTTWILFRLEVGHWRFWENLELSAVLVNLGAWIYAMVAVGIEVGGRTVVWAYEQWKKDRAKREELVREMVRKELEGPMRNALRTELEGQVRESVREAILSEERKRLAQWIKDGHTVEEWLAQSDGETSRR